MDSTVNKLQQFIDYVQILSGDEKGEAQVFCDRLFQAFGHKGYKEAGATLEERVKRKGERTKFADLVWKPRLLLEMKKRGAPLERHYRQAFEYWMGLVPHRPRYVVLCNFDQFWIYDFDLQLDTPVDTILVEELPHRYTAFNFLFPVEKKPQFGNDRVAVTRSAADKIARIFNSLIGRDEDRAQSQRFMLQCVMAMFSEDFNLLPRGLFTEIVNECVEGGSSYDLIGGLFRQMNERTPARGGRYKDVQYFNGGLYSVIEPIELNLDELSLLSEAVKEDWSRVEPPIFGTLFENSMGKSERHAYGAHFTSEVDIYKVVNPTITRPWHDRIAGADTLKQLLSLREELLKFRVLDPTCGSGNFLYVAYRELKRIEMDLLEKIHENFKRAEVKVGTTPLLSLRQFYGMDNNPFAVELAKVTLMLAKELALKESRSVIDTIQSDLPLQIDSALPLDNLDRNILCADSLFTEWPEAEAIIGNPPFQSKNKMQLEYGADYINQLRNLYPDIPGRADYCVYWFRRAHDELIPGQRAGLVGTNTIRQNYSREGGLDYIVQNGGTITEAVSTQVWSGDAVVHVSIVNWLKGTDKRKKKLFTQLGDNRDSPWEVIEVERINPALSTSIDVTKAQVLSINVESGACYQGQTHGHKGFLLTPLEATQLKKEPASRPYIQPYLTGDDILGNLNSSPSRYAIDLNRCEDLFSAMEAGQAYKLVEEMVMPAMKANAKKERELSKKDTGPRQSHVRQWWKYWRGRTELLDKLEVLPRYIACARVTRRPIFEFVHNSIRPNDALQVFPLSDDYSFGILQSGVHWEWFIARCSTLKRDFRYTSNTVFDSFPWPQCATPAQCSNIAAAAVSLRQLRRKLMIQKGWTLRDLYRTLDLPGRNPLKDSQAELDSAVRSGYGMKNKSNVLEYLMDLNLELSVSEWSGEVILGPGLPATIRNPKQFISEDCIDIQL
jgi:hypothetical protein